MKAAVLRDDLKSADHYLRLFPTPPAVPETVPGTTAVGISARVLNEFKARGAADLTTYYAIFDPQPFAGRLERVEKQDVGVAVIVNGKLVASRRPRPPGIATCSPRPLHGALRPMQRARLRPCTPPPSTARTLRSRRGST